MKKESIYSQKCKELSDLRLEYKCLEKHGNIKSTYGKSLHKLIFKLSKELKVIDASLGRYTTPRGSYNPKSSLKRMTIFEKITKIFKKNV